MSGIVIPTAAELYARLKAQLDDYQVDGWEGRDGQEFYRALCDVAAAAIARAGARLRARRILQASGATRATGTVTVTWAGATVDAVGLRPGQIIAQTPWGVRYYLTEPLERAAGAAAGSVTVGVAALWAGREGNVEAAHVSEWALPGGVDPTSEIAWIDYGETKASGTLLVATTGAASYAAGHEFYLDGLTFIDRAAFSTALASDTEITVEAAEAGAAYNIGDGESFTWEAFDTGDGNVSEVLGDFGDMAGGQSDTLGRAEFLAAVTAGTITITGATDMTGGSDGELDLIAMGRGLPRAYGETDAALQRRIRTLPDVVTPAAILRVVNAALEPYGVTATLHEPWDYAFAFGSGAFGVHPPSRLAHFVVAIPSIAYDTPGFAFGSGAFGIHPIGTPDLARAAVYAGLQAMVDQIKLGGVWASVREATA